MTYFVGKRVVISCWQSISKILYFSNGREISSRNSYANLLYA